MDGVPADYLFSVEIFGTETGGGLTSGTLFTPTGFPIPLSPAAGGRLVGGSRLPDDSSFPDDDYGLVVMDGGVEKSGLVNFAPEVPNGYVDITSPANGALGVARDATFEFANGCTNCDSDIFLLLLGSTASQSAFVDPTAVSHTFPSPLEANTPHLFLACIVVESTSSANISGDLFTYKQFAFEDNSIEFDTTPPPPDPRITGLLIDPSTGMGSVTFTSEAGLLYELHGSDGGPFLPGETPITTGVGLAGSTTLGFADTAATGSRTRIYRVEAKPSAP